MAEALAAAGRLREAASLAADYGGPEAAALAVGRLVQAHGWREALATAYRRAPACQPPASPLSHFGISRLPAYRPVCAATFEAPTC